MAFEIWRPKPFKIQERNINTCNLFRKHFVLVGILSAMMGYLFSLYKCWSCKLHWMIVWCIMWG